MTGTDAAKMAWLEDAGLSAIATLPDRLRVGDASIDVIVMEAAL